jgi:(1->4)-alpha-D-glucan 1-alpha-D-glucosylmutase
MNMSHDSQAIEKLLRGAMDRIKSNRRLPESTYRLQLNGSFTFRDAAALVPYLAKLGVTHLYASPYLKANPGSTHGYDVIDHCRLNPELGTTADYNALVAALREQGMAHIADIVPNHVGIATNDNIWWNDVLESGPASIYAEYFDISWAGSPLTDLNGRVLIPILGSMYGEELEKGNLRLSFEKGAFFVSYHERKFPISPRSFPKIFMNELQAGQADESAVKEYQSIRAECEALPDRCEGSAVARERHEKKEQIKRRLAELAARSEAVQKLIAHNLRQFNGTVGQPASFDRLDNLLRHQCFRLASWKTAPDEINYRRFFDVNTLAALAMERIEVFEATHGFILGLLAENKIAGLRVDHPDGLYDPEVYFHRLQAHYVLAVAREAMNASDRFGGVNWEEIRPVLLDRLNRQLPVIGSGAGRWPLYVLGEKILALEELLPKTWAIDGTSGYDFLNMTNGLFVDSSSAGEFTRLYHAWIEDETGYEEIAYCKKKMILEISLASELNMLAIRLKRIAQQSRYGIDYSLHGLLIALKEVLACFPVYRSYITVRGASEMDRGHIQHAIDAAIRRNPGTEPSIFHFIGDALLIRGEAELTADERTARRQFAGKFQQLSSPATAKGIEDTAFYIYNRLLSLNEVGGDPSRFGVSPEELHAFFGQRQRDWPYAMSTQSTHDTKRSEDVRARLNVLSEMPREWREKLQRWGDLNAPHRAMVEGRPVPDRNEEYALYQTLLGTWPLQTGEMESFKQRVQSYTLKSIREARIYSSWTDPNTAHEAAVHGFIDAILSDSIAGEFLADFMEFQKRISHYGFFNSLSQTLIKLTAPGVPDTYQGNEIFDFSLVDPDNRRPVDFHRRQKLMDKIGEQMQERSKPFGPAESDCLKLIVHRNVLNIRTQYPGLFTVGQYVPIHCGGSKGAHIFAFARSHAGRTAIVAAPRLFSGLIDAPMGWSCGPDVWGDTFIAWPESVRDEEFRNVFSGVWLNRSGSGDSTTALAAALFGDWPVALLISR